MDADERRDGRKPHALAVGARRLWRGCAAPSRAARARRTRPERRAISARLRSASGWWRSSARPGGGRGRRSPCRRSPRFHQRQLPEVTKVAALAHSLDDGGGWAREVSRDRPLAEARGGHLVPGVIANSLADDRGARDHRAVAARRRSPGPARPAGLWHRKCIPGRLLGRMAEFVHASTERGDEPPPGNHKEFYK